ncbi:MAG: polyphenol oxidase family protein, partial [Verrucomicrobiales bacterium]
RSPYIGVDMDRETALARLEPYFDEQLDLLGIRREHLATGDQVHDCRLAVIDGEQPSSSHFPDTDGLLTATPGQFLGVYVADCGAVFIVDPVKRACAVVHSGKKGTELGIAPKAITLMQEIYGSEPADLIVQLAPCIRPPAYDIDFAAQIMRDCVRVGIPEAQVNDCGTCTSSDLARYYSYRVEKGKTGRHFALIGWESI